MGGEHGHIVVPVDELVEVTLAGAHPWWFMGSSSIEDQVEDVLSEADTGDPVSVVKAFRSLEDTLSSKPPWADTDSESAVSRYIPVEARREVWVRDGGVCVACGSSEQIEFDHRKPVSRGGSSSESNIQLLCRTCNAEKGAQTMEEWRPEA